MYKFHPHQDSIIGHLHHLLLSTHRRHASLHLRPTVPPAGPHHPPRPSPHRHRLLGTPGSPRPQNPRPRLRKPAAARGGSVALLRLLRRHLLPLRPLLAPSPKNLRQRGGQPAADSPSDSLRVSTRHQQAVVYFSQ